MADRSDRGRAPDAHPVSLDDVQSGRGGARLRRRVVALSSQDRERVARGESPQDLALADYEHDALNGLGTGLDAPASGGTGSNDARLRREVPPHWG